MSVAELMRVIRCDRRYYDNSGGGVTLTGGEPLSQCQFAMDVLRTCKAEGIHTAIETCGYADWNCIASVLPFLDLVFFDVKQIDSTLHRENTGVPNERILENLACLAEAFTDGELIIRIPFVPGCNGDEETMKEIFSRLASLRGVKQVEIMPYHRLGTAKYDGIGRPYRLRGLEPVQRSELTCYTDLGRSFGLDVRIDSR